MRNYKQLIPDTSYILCVGTGLGGTEITEAEYRNIIEAIRQKPVIPGYDHHIVDGSVQRIFADGNGEAILDDNGDPSWSVTAEYVPVELPVIDTEDEEAPDAVVIDILTEGADI